MKRKLKYWIAVAKISGRSDVRGRTRKAVNDSIHKSEHEKARSCVVYYDDGIDLINKCSGDLTQSWEKV